jgi:hypothetical protein
MEIQLSKCLLIKKYYTYLSAFKTFFFILSGQKYINDNINFHAYKLKKIK